jgi:uncharacterized protein (DUF1684 family)
MTNTAYRQSIHEWRKERNETIRKENGWLSLAGLFWLKIGKNQLGSDPKSEILLPARSPAHLGYLEYDGGSVSLHSPPSQKINVNDTETDFAVLQPDISDNPSYIKLLDIQLVVIQRGNKFGVRMWDNQREERRSFPARTWFDIDEDFRVPTTYTPYDRPRLTFFPNIAGEKSELLVDGYLSFQLKGRDFQLDINKEDDIIRFWDPTGKDETYPTGRYLVTDVEADGRIFTDFNKAYSPPCAFTDFATCMFAPEQNHLDFRIIPGETYIHR